MNTCTLVLVIIVIQAPLTVAETNCTDAGVVVVASVFATLAVVFIVLAIIGFLIWRRRRDILKPEKLKTDVTDNGNKFGYSNPAFDVESGEGTPGHESSREYKHGKNTYVYGQERDLAKKTWSSLPPSDLPDVRQRKSSLGSLDKFISDNNREEVWLTSQDFIGLGFNIAGSMRDGIFVSQVHNRGPAKESGKFKVGDRIMNVGISFENMVYEDALTILSYASPYPVKVTLQKQQTIPKNRKLSDVRTNLNHPLYRSNSVDVLDMHTSEKSFYPKRAASEMHHCQRNSPNGKKITTNGQDSIIFEEFGVGVTSPDNEVFEIPAPKTNAVVHTVTNDGKEKVALGKEVFGDIDSNIPAHNVDLKIPNSESKSLDSDVPYSSSQPQFIDPFETLTEQDKIDMLRLSYTDPDAVVSFDKQQKSADVDVDFKSVPVKPERKKKSSTNSSHRKSDIELQGSLPSTPVPSVVDDEVFASALVPPTEAPPPIPVQDNEADETLVLPETKTRNVTIGSKSIVFQTRLETSDILNEEKTTEDDGSSPDIHVSESNNEVAAGIPKDILGLSPVVEETITATQIQKERKVPLSLNNFSLDANTDECKEKCSETTDRNDDTTKNDADIQKVLPSNLPPNDNFDGSLTESDHFSLDMDSVIFKEPFTNKNTKQKENSFAYDISVTELEAMEQAVLDEERKKHELRKKKGGIAFEVRDDYVTGELRTVNHLNIHRTASYDTSLSSDRISARNISSQRPTSFKGEGKARNETDNGLLEWSGKRLVRSGSFTEIPQGDAVKDWTDEKDLIEDDAVIEKHIQEDSVSTSLRKLTKATFVQSFRTSEKGVEDLSDTDSQCQSISSSCSSGNDKSPMNSFSDVTNIKDSNDEGLNMFSATSEDKDRSVTNLKSDIITEYSKTVENDEALMVTLNTAENVEEDC
ncbi:uncharacterized protein LOC123536170 [Mercenaria mercenaria]|uniref:uncharacterized protein LOC123536170 n=1 Tax=Mercenaria mercenaria TaxID=6596 RepID=UPI00234FAF24|nr:uncharacterized protein LOC123536170 [Mercenaria mercenaria]